MIKKIVITCFIIFLLPVFAYSADKNYVGLMKIDPEKNAYVHNNFGLSYLEMGQYQAAIQEFKIAISLNPNSQATALFLNNLGETYIKLGYYNQAQQCFEDAIDKSPLTFRYYLNLVSSYQLQGISDSKLKYLLKNKKTPLDDITIGLLYIAKRQTDTGIAILERFVMNEPKLYITDGVKYYLNNLIEDRKNGKY